MMLLQDTARLSTDHVQNESFDASASLAALSASIVSIDNPDAFDDCDVALDQTVPISRVCTPVMREPSPMLRAPAPVTSAPATPCNMLADCLMGDDMQTAVPTPLDGGIAIVSLTVSMGVASCVMDELRAIPTAGAFVMAASLAAAHVHGTQTPYTERYGSSTPAGVVVMAAAYFACGVVLVGIRSLS